MKTARKVFSLLLAFVMLALSVPFAFAEGGTTYQVGDHIQFGTYPQTRVDETPALKKAAENATWKSYGYYSGTAVSHSFDELFNVRFQSGNWMQFADFFSKGEKYRAVIISLFRPTMTCFMPRGADYSDYSYFSQPYDGYMLNTTYYFKYEPLNWRVLNPEEGLLMCESVIDSQAFHNTIYRTEENFYDPVNYPHFADQYYWQDSTASVYANDYSASSIKCWLNQDFYETAFTSRQKELIQNSEISLPSLDDITNSAYGFSTSEGSSETRQARATDYAKSQGFTEDWYLRTSAGPFEMKKMFTDYNEDTGERIVNIVSRCSVGDSAYAVGSSGAYDCMPIVMNVCGIRPVCKLAKLASDNTVSDGLFSGGTHTHSYTASVTTPATCTEKGVMTYTCECGDNYTDGIAIDANAHADLNENGDCPRCGKHVKDVEQPTDAADDKPSDEKPAENLNFFQRIIQWFRNLFAKLFRR